MAQANLPLTLRRLPGRGHLGAVEAGAVAGDHIDHAEQRVLPRRLKLGSGRLSVVLGQFGIGIAHADKLGARGRFVMVRIAAIGVKKEPSDPSLSVVAASFRT